MPTPLPIETYPTREDKVDLAGAALINPLQASIVTIETALNALINTDGSLRQGTSFPGSPVTGQVFYRTDLQQLYVYSGSGWAPPGALSNIQFFSASGTFVCPTGITQVYLTMVNPGNGGNASNGGVQGSGGNGGNYIINVPYTVVPGNSYPVTVGAGGVGGTGNSGMTGSGGTPCSFDTITIGNAGFNAVTSTGGGRYFAGGTGAAGGGGGGGPFGTGGNLGLNNGTGFGSGGGGGPGGGATNAGNGAPGFVIVAY